MDMDIEVEEFKKRNAPSLIGSSIRDSSDKIASLKSFESESSTMPYVKSDSTVDLVPVDEIVEEGGLNADQEDEELDEVLDKEGHVKKELIPEASAAEASVNQSSTNLITPAELKELNVEEDKIDDGNKETILGGDADQYLAPAGGSSSNYTYPLKKKKGTDLTQSDNPVTFIEPDKMRSVDDIINVVNKGDFEKASTLIDDNVAKAICPETKALSLNEVKETDEPVVPDSAIEVDSEFTAPAAMREGSESRLLEEQRSRSLSRYGNSSSRNDASGERPNLARGESIHSGLNGDLSITNTYDQSSHSLVSERRPRHDPSGARISNSSSLNYLRSISRSRSRMANDRRALGEDLLDSKDLRESGALINDDSMSNRSDIEYAVNKALDFVEDTHSVKGGKRISDSGDIVKNLQKGLAEVAEEEQASNRKTLNSSDLLDQLANSAMELMLDESQDEGEGEEENDFTGNDVENTIAEENETFNVAGTGITTDEAQEAKIGDDGENKQTNKDSTSELSSKTDGPKGKNPGITEMPESESELDDEKEVINEDANSCKNENSKSETVEPHDRELTDDEQKASHINATCDGQSNEQPCRNNEVETEAVKDDEIEADEGKTEVIETEGSKTSQFGKDCVQSLEAKDSPLMKEEPSEKGIASQKKRESLQESDSQSENSGQVSDDIQVGKTEKELESVPPVEKSEGIPSFAEKDAKLVKPVDSDVKTDEERKDLFETKEADKKTSISSEPNSANTQTEQKEANAVSNTTASNLENPAKLADDFSQNSAKSDVSIIAESKSPDLEGGDLEKTAVADKEKNDIKAVENQPQKASTADEDFAEKAIDSSHIAKAAVESNPAVEKDADDTDALIAAAAREKALKESFNPLGKDGSVFVPKVEKMTFEDEPVYLYTSFAGGFQVTTRTNRLVTILTANRIKFEYRDLGTDEEAKKVWRRYSAGKTLPGIVRGKDDFIGNWQDIEEANEDYRVRSLIYETY